MMGEGDLFEFAFGRAAGSAKRFAHVMEPADEPCGCAFSFSGDMLAVQFSAVCEAHREAVATAMRGDT